VLCLICQVKKKPKKRTFFFFLLLIMSLIVPFGSLVCVGVLYYVSRRLAYLNWQYLFYISPLGYYYSLKGERDKAHSITSATEYPEVKIVPVPIRDDNYSYLVIDKANRLAVAVDPAGQ